jgi:hypothetical protein
VWENVQRRAHQPRACPHGEGKGLDTKGGKVVIDLSPIIAQVKQKLGE